MCGILCSWQRNLQPVAALILKKGVENLRHRGPDDEGYVLINSHTSEWVACRGENTDGRLALPDLDQMNSRSYDLALGQTRLSILDLSPAGHQPMSSPDGRLHLVFNGEIYNFQEIRLELQARGFSFSTNSDTEVVLCAYRAWGVECLQRFNGMWAFALWDADKRSLFVARDRFGVKPLVYYADADRFICASEIKAILADPAIPREIDAEALHHYLSLTMIPAPFTIYKNIRKLLPGHFMWVNEKEMRIARYWELPVEENLRESESEAMEHLDTLLQDAVRLRLIADVPVGAFLSGGVDSSLVCALAARQVEANKLRTFSISFRELASHDESVWANRVASHIGSEHMEYELSIEFLEALRGFSELMDEPFATSSVLGVYLLAQQASRYNKVVLTGDGGDEVFAGYWSRQVGIDRTWDKFQRKPFGWLLARSAVNGWSPVRWEDETLLQRLGRRWRWEQFTDQEVRDRWYLRSIMWAASDAEMHRLYTPEWENQVHGKNTEEWFLKQIPPIQSDRLSRWQRFDLSTTLADEMLAKVDKATMAWGLEARTPMLDYRLVKYVINLPSQYKIRGDQGKYILKRVGERYLPQDVLYRRKQGFNVPLAHWFRGALKGFLDDILSEEELQAQGIIQSGIVQHLIADHQAGADYSTLLFNLICFQLWYRSQYR